MNIKAIATMFIFESESTPGKSYQTLLYTGGSTSCECPGFIFKRKTTADGQRTCRHVRDIEAGEANRHAKKVVEYLTATTARKPQRAMESATLPARTGRAFYLGES